MHSAVVIVFKTAISMDVKRRENDKQIIELRTIMKEMMSELLRYVLSHPRDPSLTWISSDSKTQEICSDRSKTLWRIG